MCKERGHLPGSVLYQWERNWFAMSGWKYSLVATIVLFSVGTMTVDPAQPKTKVVLVIHGGAGALSKEKMTPELEKQYRADLENALREGHKILRREGGTCVDAVEAAVKVLEDS